MTPPATSAKQRASDARRRERRFRESAREKRDRGEGLLACLFDRSADAQAALARLAEGVGIDDPARATRGTTALTGTPLPPPL